MYTRSFCFLPDTGTRSMWCSCIFVKGATCQPYIGRLTKQICFKVQVFQERYLSLHTMAIISLVKPQMLDYKLPKPLWFVLGDRYLPWLPSVSFSCVVNTILQPEYCSHSTKEGWWVGNHLRTEQSTCIVMQ